MDSLVYTIIAPFRHSGTDSIKVKDFDFILSFDLKWMSPGQAASLRARAMDAGLLKENGGLLSLSFDSTSVTIPRNFRPPEELSDNLSLVDSMIRYIALCGGKEPGEVAGEVRNFQARLSGMVDPEVAAFLAGREDGCDMEVFYDKVGEKLAKGDKGA